MIAYVLSVIGHLFRYMNFTVVKQNKTITITTGLLQKKSISTSIERVQAIAVKESPIRYLFGYVSVHLIHAGGHLMMENMAVSCCFRLFVKMKSCLSLRRAFLNIVCTIRSGRYVHVPVGAIC